MKINLRRLLGGFSKRSSNKRKGGELMAKKKTESKKVDILEVLERVLNEFPMAVGMRAAIRDKVAEELKK